MPKRLIRQVNSWVVNVLECSPLCFAFVILVRAFILFCPIASRTIFTSSDPGKKHASRQDIPQSDDSRMNTQACWIDSDVQDLIGTERYQQRCWCTYIALFIPFRVSSAHDSWHVAANYWFSWTMSLFRGRMNIPPLPHLYCLRDVPDPWPLANFSLAAGRVRFRAETC